MQPDTEAWDPWHPRVVAQRLTDLPVPWYVAGGWAIDLFAGEQTREHEDTEIAVPASAFGLLPPLLPEIEFWMPIGPGRLGPFDPAGESHQTWAWDAAAGSWRLDVFREPGDGGTWICRRDERIRLPYSSVIARTPDGVPYLVPEITLLFKAKWDLPKNDADLATALPRLTAAQRTWLDDALALVHPDHRWRSALR